MKNITLFLAISLIATVGFGFVGQTGVFAAALSSGDILVADPSAPTENGGVYHLNSAGGQVAVYDGGNFTEPTGIAIDGNGNILVGDPQAFSLGGAIFKIDPLTGTQTTLSSGGYFVDPRGLAVAANGDIYVADSDAFGYYGGVIKVDPATGAQSIVYISHDVNAGPLHLAIEADGNIVVSDVSGASRGVVRINPVTGVGAQLASGGYLSVPVGIAVAPNGNIFVADNSGWVVKVDPATGAQTLVASGWPLACPTGLAFDNNGDLLVGDPCNEPGAVVKINLADGSMSVLANFGSSPQGIAVMPASATCISPLPDTVSWWPGEGSANDIIDGNSGTLQNGAAFAAGQVGQAFSFDGVDDKVLIGNPANLRLQDFTIDAWIKLNTLDINGFAERIAGYGIGGYGFFLSGPSVVNAYGATAVRQLSLDKPGFDMVAAPLAVNDLGWHHVAVTKSGGTVTFYLDGVAGAAQRGGSPFPSYNPGFVFNTNFTLGNFDTQVQPFPGLLDEVEVFNRALTSSEIQQYYQNGVSCAAATELPIIAVPAPIVVEATSPEGTAVFYEVTAADNVGVTSLACAPASGSIFALGTTAVACTASDAAGNTSEVAFNITVQDTTPPALTAPAPVNVETSSLDGVVVDWEMPTAADAVGVAGIVCSPVPGSIFPVGVTVVICTAFDTSGNSTSRSFEVTVRYVAPPPVIITVNMDIKPGSFPNSINPKNQGKIPVAILSTSGFNAPAQIDKSSLTFGRTGDEQSLSFCGIGDVNSDGLADLICHFQTQTAGFQAGDTEGVLKGKTTAGVDVIGKDSVRIVPK